MKSAFIALRGGWRGIIDSSIRAKRNFQNDADECMMFFNGPYDFLWDGMPQRGDYLYAGMKKIQRPPIVMTINKVAELLQIFGPNMYFQNPVNKVNPRKPPQIPPEAFGDQNDPHVQAVTQPIFQELDQQQMIDAVRAILISAYTNWLPTAIGLGRTSRQMIDEALIKGMGILLARMERTADGLKLPMLEYVSVNRLIMDADYDDMDKAKWVAIQYCEPVWEVEAKRGIPHGTLKGNYESSSSIGSSTSQSSTLSDTTGTNRSRPHGATNDLIIYWKVWSKMGLGGLVKGMAKDASEADRFGQYVYFEVADNVDFFLNAPESVWGNEKEMHRRFQWETPFWADEPTSNGWPFEPCIFHRVPNQVWPMSHIRPGMGELKFLNWAYSFLISRIQKTTRDFIVADKALEEEITEKILEGGDLTLLPISAALGKPISEVIAFLKHPEVNKDIFTILQDVEVLFEKRTGLTELLYGLQKSQDRSATETKTKENYVNVRPEDMKKCVEDTMTNALRKITLMCRWHLSGDDVAKIYGPTIGKLWQTHVATADISEILHALEYRIEAGSTSKPNKDKDKDDANATMQSLFAPLLQHAAATGDYDPVNTLLEFYANALDMDALRKLKLKPPAPPPPPPPPPPKVSVTLDQEGVQALGLAPAIQKDFGIDPSQVPPPLDAQAQGMIHKEADHQQDTRHADEMHKLKLKQAKEKAAANGKSA